MRIEDVDLYRAVRENIGSKRFDCSGAGYADGRFSLFPGLRRRRRNFPSPVSALFAQVVGYRLFDLS